MGQTTRASRPNQNLAAACSNAIGFVGSANDRRLCFEQIRRRSASPPLTVASIVMNRGETMLERSAVLLFASSNEEEDEAADHDRGGERADDEDGGENRVELMNKLIVLRSFIGDAAAAILVASTALTTAMAAASTAASTAAAALAAAGVRPCCFALRGSSRCRPLGGCRRRCRRCRRRRRRCRWAKASECSLKSRN